MLLVWLIPVAVLLAIIVIAALITSLLRKDTGTPEMQRVAGAIREGAYAFLRRQYRTIAMLALIVAVILFFTARDGWHTAVAFALGALASGLSGLMACGRPSPPTSAPPRPRGGA